MIELTSNSTEQSSRDLKQMKFAVALSFNDWNLLSQVRGFTHRFWAVICVLI